MTKTKNKGKGKAKAKDKDMNNKEAENKAHQTEPTQKSTGEKYADKGFTNLPKTVACMRESFMEPRFNRDGSVYLVARRDCEIGDVLIRERPMTRLDRPPKPSAEDIALLRREVSSWEPTSRILFFMLPNAWPLLDKVYSTFYTYSTHITAGDAAETQKVKGEPLYFFLTTSFLEHSCHPNTAQMVDVESNTIEVIANTDIPKGAKLTRYFLSEQHDPLAIQTEHLRLFSTLCKCRMCEPRAESLVAF